MQFCDTSVFEENISSENHKIVLAGAGLAAKMTASEQALFWNWFMQFNDVTVGIPDKKEVCSFELH